MGKSFDWSAYQAAVAASALADDLKVRVLRQLYNSNILYNVF